MLHKHILLVDSETTSSINGSMTQKVVHCFDSLSTGKSHFVDAWDATTPTTIELSSCKHTVQDSSRGHNRLLGRYQIP